MVNIDDVHGNFLQKPLGEGAVEVAERAPSVYSPLTTFTLNKDRSYQQQYGDMYFLRLTKIKPAMEQIAETTWEGTVIGGEPAKKVERVLDVRQGELCYVTGTVYMDMPLKPNILEDVSKDRWISAPTSGERYYSEDGIDAVMLEDDSGRIRLVGDVLKSVILVTGCIIAVMGTENVNGEFDVIDMRFPDLPVQPERWNLTKPVAQNGAKSITKKETKIKQEDVEMLDSDAKEARGKIAIVSGLNFSGSDTSYGTELNILLEYLLGEALDPVAQKELAHISRLIIAGNSIAVDQKPLEDEGDKKSHKKYGYDSSTYNALPSQLLDEFLAEVLPTMPVTLLPGAQDPANSSFPQQPIHNAMFPRARQFAAMPGSSEPGWFDPVTNPVEAEIDGWRVLGTAGQNVNDMARYVASNDRLGMMEAMCRWQCCAPTAPDTLWSYPFQDDDPFVISNCPHIYFAGCQAEFATKLIQGTDGQFVRLIAVPNFSSTHEIVLIDSETLDVSRVKIATG